MTASDFRRRNVDRFERLLGSEDDPEKLALIRRLLADERLKHDAAYPDPDAPGDRLPPDTLRMT